MNKSVLQNGDVLTMKDGDKYILYNEKLYDLDGVGYDLDDFDYDLNHDYNNDRNFVKIEKLDGTVITNEIEEMTLAEVCEELGREIKIVKEKE